MNFKHHYLWILCALVFSACGNEGTQSTDTTQPAPAGEAEQAQAQQGNTGIPPYELADSSAIQQTSSGMQYYIVEKGGGNTAQAGQTVLAHYHGMLPDGQVFDSSFERGQPFSFTLGQGQVIAGWDEAFGMLPVGTKAILILPPHLAYGERGSPPKIAPNQTLHFHVQLLGTSN